MKHVQRHYKQKTITIIHKHHKCGLSTNSSVISKTKQSAASSWPRHAFLRREIRRRLNLNSSSTQTILTHQNRLNRRTTHWVPESAAHKNEQEKQHEHQPHDVGFTRESRTHTRKQTRRRRMYVEKISREQQTPASYNICDRWNPAIKCATCTHLPVPTKLCPTKSRSQHKLQIVQRKRTAASQNGAHTAKMRCCHWTIVPSRKQCVARDSYRTRNIARTNAQADWRKKLCNPHCKSLCTPLMRGTRYTRRYSNHLRN